MGSEWNLVTLDRVVEVNPKVKLEKGKSYPYVDMKAIDPFGRNVTHSEMRIFFNGGSKFQTFDTLLARITPCLENGKIAKYTPPDAQNDTAFGSTEFIVLREKEGVTNHSFVYYLARWQEFRHFAILQMNGSSGRQRVATEALCGFQFCLPPLPEQKAIAHILGTLDDKIELNRKMNETLEAMAQALFKSWFVDFDPVIDNALAAGYPIPDELKAQADIRANLGDQRKPLPADIQSLFPSEFQHTEELGCIPKGWEVKSLGSLIAYVIDNRGKTPPLPQSQNSNILFPLVEVNALKGSNRFFEPKSISKFIDHKTYNNWFRKGHPRIGDVLLSTVGSIAEVCLVDDEQCCIAQNIIALRSFSSISGLYLYEILKHYKKSLVNLDISSVQPSIKVPHLMNMKILDGHGLHDVFGNSVKKYSNQYKRNQKQQLILSNLRDTLLPKLLSGEIRISDAEKFMEERT